MSGIDAIVCAVFVALALTLIELRSVRRRLDRLEAAPPNVNVTAYLEQPAPAATDAEDDEEFEQRHVLH
jgi:hypothetical protein